MKTVALAVAALCASCAPPESEAGDLTDHDVAVVSARDDVGVGVARDDVAADPAEGPPADVAAPPDDAGDPVSTAASAPASCTAVARPPLPATCPFHGNEVVVWGQEGWNVLGDAFAANLSPCTDVFISIATASTTTELRAGQASAMRARSPQIHALAEFHYATWSQKKQALGVSWREIGRMFRDEMDAKGYCVAAGDTWAINEAPSAVRKSAAFRVGFADLVAGLAEGRTGMPFAKGAVFLQGMGQQTMNFSVYKPNVEAWLRDSAFWVKMNNNVRFLGGEVYADPASTCLGATAVVDRRRRINSYAEHLFKLAAAGPDVVNTAQSFLSRAYVPILNAVWDASPERGYGDTTISLANMQKHLRAQVDATRSFADAHTAPDGRIGFGFASYHDPDEWDALGATVADAVRGAYGAGASASGACAGEGCACTMSGAAENTGWSAFATW